jgi:hypothetical protein
VTAICGGAVTLAEAADAFLSSPRAASPNTRRAYAGVIDRLAAEPGPHPQLAAVPGDEIAAALRRLWDNRAPRRRGTTTGPPSLPTPDGSATCHSYARESPTLKPTPQKPEDETVGSLPPSADH